MRGRRFKKEGKGSVRGRRFKREGKGSLRARRFKREGKSSLRGRRLKNNGGDRGWGKWPAVKRGRENNVCAKHLT